MKAFIYIIFALISLQSVGQNSIGYVNTQHIVDAMPEKILAEEKLEEYIKQRQTELQEMHDIFDQKILRYQSMPPDTSAVILEFEQQKLTEMQKKLEEETRKFEEDIYTYQDELMAPVMERAIQMIKQVARKNGYQHVFEVTSPIIFPEGTEITQLVIEALRKNDSKKNQ